MHVISFVITIYSAMTPRTSYRKDNVERVSEYFLVVMERVVYFIDLRLCLRRV